MQNQTTTSTATKLSGHDWPQATCTCAHCGQKFQCNAHMPRSYCNGREPNNHSAATLLRVLPALKVLKLRETESVALVNATAVEEVLKDIAMLEFGKGIEAKANVAVWRTRGDQKQLVGEFAYQIKVDQVGGYRLLFSHNVQFPLSAVPINARTCTSSRAAAVSSSSSTCNTPPRNGSRSEPPKPARFIA